MSQTKKIKHLLSSTNSRTLVSNFIYLSLLKAASFVFGLVTLPYLAHVIGTDYFGAIAFATAIMALAETITDWGFNYTATRDVAVVREDPDKVSKIYSEVFFAKLILMAVSFIILLALIYMIPSLAPYRLLLILTFLYIPGQIMLPDWLFQAFEKMKCITILNIVAKGLFTVLIFIVIRHASDYIFQPLLNAAGFIISGIIAQYIIFRYLKVRLNLPSPESVIRRIKASTNMFISLIMPNLYNNFSTIILKAYCGDFATGIYSGGQRFQQILDQLTAILSRTFFPFLARNKNSHHIYVLISGSIAVGASLIMFFGAELFVKTFLSPEFSDSVIVIKIFAISPFFLFLMNTYGTNYLIIINKEEILRNIIVVVSLIGFLLTWIFTPRFSYIGAALTITLTWGIRGFVTLYYAKKEAHSPQDKTC